ncbi:MAG: class I SAM-dependent methyltransferase [Candidatus Acidiferrum sp.]
MNWLVQNFNNRVRFALENPLYTLNSLCRELTLADERFLSAITNVSASRIRGFIKEPVQNGFFSARLQSVKAELQTLKIYSADLYAKKILLQYAVVRAFQPKIVVETGVANGVSSAYILLALQANGRGTLYSVGLYEPQYLPAGKPLGWVVPQELRSPWKLLVGDSRTILPRLLGEIGSTDIFIHDSLHTYEHMLWEYRVAYPHLRPGGLLFSDDAKWNTAFPEFALEVDAPRAKILRGVGFLQKTTG